MSLLPAQSDLEGPVLGGDSRGVIPLEVARLPVVVEVDGFPIWIVAEVEGSTVVAEFVREDQLEL